MDRLHSTCTVLGLFKEWKCVIEEVSFLPGDLLVIYTDGVSEAANEAGEEFGEVRIVECLRRHRELCPETLIEELVKELRGFALDEQQDDVTLIVAKAR